LNHENRRRGKDGGRGMMTTVTSIDDYKFEALCLPFCTPNWPEVLSEVAGTLARVRIDLVECSNARVEQQMNVCQP
jgi:hypothetical protein